MTVDIEDGQVQSASSGSLPSVRKGVVSTEATLTGEQSLLIGGYNSEQRVVGNTKVPILGDLPGLGTFFSNKSDSIQRRERLFLLKARVVTSTSVASAATGPSNSSSPEPKPAVPTLAPRQSIVR
jgi:type III secretion protein C